MHKVDGSGEPFYLSHHPQSKSNQRHSDGSLFFQEKILPKRQMFSSFFIFRSLLNFKLMRLSKEQKRQEKCHEEALCKVRIVWKPSFGGHTRLHKALSMLLSKEDILNYFAEKSLKENCPAFVSVPSNIDKETPKVLKSCDEGRKD